MTTQQSPIDITDADVFKTSDLRAKITWTSLTLKFKQARKFEVSKADGVLIVDGLEYEPIELHWHFPSEHAQNGKRYHGEVHIVHVEKGRRDNLKKGRIEWEKLAVLGVYLKRGKRPYAPITCEEAMLEAIAKREKEGKGRPKLTETLGRDQILPSNSSAVRYPGSLTTPPYSENVKWIVFDKPASATTKQTPQRFKNARPLQDRCRRQLVRGKVVKGGSF